MRLYDFLYASTEPMQEKVNIQDDKKTIYHGVLGDMPTRITFDYQNFIVCDWISTNYGLLITIKVNNNK